MASEDGWLVASLTVTLGAWGDVRDALRHHAFKFAGFTWYEGRGWFERRFSVKGPAHAVRSFLAGAEELGRLLDGGTDGK